MNQSIGNPIFYYHRTDCVLGRVIASLTPLREMETLNYIGKRYLFADHYHSVSWRYDQPPVFFDHKAAAGCFAACHDTGMTTHEVDSPLTGTFLMLWASETMNVGTRPKYGNIVFTDEDGIMELRLERTWDEPGVLVRFQRMIVENHEWAERHFDPALCMYDRQFDRNEAWRLSLSDWHKWIAPLGEQPFPNPVLFFSDEKDEENEEMPFSFRYMDRRHTGPMEVAEEVEEKEKK